MRVLESYGRDDRVPFGTLLVAVLQHMGLMSIILIFPLLVADAAGLDLITTARLVTLSMIAIGIASFLQCLGWRGIGSGFLLPAVFTAAYLPPVLAAARLGGLGAVAGLMLVAGLTQILLSRLLFRIRRLLPPEVMGLVVLQIGITLGLIAVRLMLTGGDVAGRGRAEFTGATVAVTLALAVGAAVWGGLAWRRAAMLLGMAGGTATHLLLPLLAGGGLPAVPPLPVEWIVWPLATPSLDLVLVPGVLVGAVACTLRAAGDIVVSQQAVDPRWRRPDFETIRGGVLADGLGTLVAGLLGTVGVNTYSASVGLARATGMLSRRIGFGIAAGWLLVGLVPGSARILLAIPLHVVAACLFFAATHIVLAGMGILTQRVLDTRRILVIGAALILGLSFDALPGFYSDLPDFARGLVSSSLALSVVVALVLNAVLQIGTAPRSRVAWRAGEAPPDLAALTEGAARGWGLRGDTATRMAMAANELGEVAALLAAPGTPLRLDLALLGTTVSLTLGWQGAALPEAAWEGAESLEAEHGAIALARRLLDHLADRTRIAPGRLTAEIED
jgi:NCS2 family nucleobase:cation symporter-2